MYKARYRFSRKELSIFYKAKSVIQYAVFDLRKQKQSFIRGNCKNAEKDHRSNFFKGKCDSVSDIMDKNNILTVNELYLAELLNEMFRQVRGRSNVDHLNFEQQKERRPTRGKTRGTLLESKHCSNVMKNARKNQIRKAYKFVKENELFQKNINKMSDAENSKFLRFSLTYI